MPKTKTKKTTPGYLEKLETEVQSNQSRLNLILGALIVLVVGVLVFNYFNRNRTPEVGPAQQSEQTQQESDVSPENLPGKYTVKEDDTLFTIAEKYYQDGFKYNEIVKANNLANENAIEVGQVLEIPKLEGVVVASPSPTESPMPSPTPAASPMMQETPNPVPAGEKGSPTPTPVTSFGPPITGDTYTVQEGDWLSTIAARAYNGDVMAYQKLAQANNISNPDLIIPGQVLKIPR